MAGLNPEKSLYNDYISVVEKNEHLQHEFKDAHEAFNLEKYLHQLDVDHSRTLEEANDEKAKIIDEKDKIIAEQAQEILRLKARLNTDGINSGLPTSKTPLNKKKVIPNTRVKTGKKRGGQEGHAKHKLSVFEDEEITERIEHREHSCPYCGGALETTGNTVVKDELDYKVVCRHQNTAYI